MLSAAEGNSAIYFYRSVHLLVWKWYIQVTQVGEPIERAVAYYPDIVVLQV
jgi:hypothetical protein